MHFSVAIMPSANLNSKLKYGGRGGGGGGGVKVMKWGTSIIFNRLQKELDTSYKHVTIFNIIIYI